MSIFNKIRLSKPKRSRHNLSYASKLTMDIGRLCPIMCEKIVPGDKFRHSHEFLLRMAPFQNQVFQGFHTTVDYFFVPSRLLWSNFESFLSKGLDGNMDFIHPYIDLQEVFDGSSKLLGSLFDYFNINTINPNGEPIQLGESQKIDALPFFAYLKIFLDYYLDENLVAPGYQSDFIMEFLNRAEMLRSDGNVRSQLSEILLMFHSLQGRQFDEPTSTDIFQPLQRAYPKDYFTSALPFAQRGPIVQIPLNGQGDVYAYTSNVGQRQNYSGVGVDWNGSPEPGDDVQVKLFRYGAIGVNAHQTSLYTVVDGSNSNNRHVSVPLSDYEQSQTDFMNEIKNAPAISFKAVNVNGTATITDLRTAQMVQMWLEKNARAGVRYKEQLASHFGVRSRDARLDRAQLIGRYNSTISIGETFTTTANSDGSFIAGMGVSNGVGSQATKPWTKFFEEHGYLIGIMSIYPTAAYHQGIPKQFQELDVFDYYWPEFQHIGEQEIKNKELFLSDAEDRTANDDVFGYTPRYAHYKSRYNQVHGDFKDSLKFMLAARDFGRAPRLNGSFISVDVDYNDLYRVFNATTELADYSPFYIDFFHNCKALRPMDYFGSPRII